MRNPIGLLLAALGLGLPQTAGARGDVTLEITARGTVYDGREFGDHGAYERISGIARLRIDPLAPENRGIVDLALAPRDADGLVAYDTDVIILRPRDPARARRVLLFDVVNRGMKTLAMFNNSSIGSSGDPIDVGDGLLMRQGYTLVWNGWQGDIAGKGMVGARFPTVSSGGKPVTGPVAAETVFDNTMGSQMVLAYPAASLDQGQAQLTVRALTDSPSIVVPPSDWSFIDNRHVALKRPAGMDAGAIYRFEYIARDPRVMGLGFAATRDLIAFLRHAPAAAGNPLADLAGAPCERDARAACANPGGGAFASAVAIGVSQSGRYLRDFVWRGFNRDLSGRPVFDGVLSVIPGARLTFTNFRFAEPGRFSRQHEDHDVPGFAFPFTYATLTDAVTGRRDGILRSCTASRTCPRLFHIDTSAEFWQAGAALAGTGGTDHDVALPGNVRAYMIAGGAHAPGYDLGKCRYPVNPLNYAPVLRALALAMVDWTLGRGEPPPSRWPRLAKGELVAPQALRGPGSQSTGLAWPKVINRPGAPAGKPAWPIFVPTLDADGNDASGIHLPQIAAPTGTYLGWNLRKPGFADGDLCFPEGAYIPFAADAASRGDDPRRSVAERYPTAGERAKRFGESVEALKRGRLLLEEDAESLNAAIR